MDCATFVLVDSAVFEFRTAEQARAARARFGTAHVSAEEFRSRYPDVLVRPIRRIDGAKLTELSSYFLGFALRRRLLTRKPYDEGLMMDDENFVIVESVTFQFPTALQAWAARSWLAKDCVNAEEFHSRYPDIPFRRFEKLDGAVECQHRNKNYLEIASTRP